MVWRLLGVLDDDTGFGKLEHGADSREIFSRKFWQPDGLSESLQGLVFAKVVQRFTYRGTTITTGIGDISKAIAIEKHSSNGWLPSSTHC
jgi:hypothetical protein